MYASLCPLIYSFYKMFNENLLCITMYLLKIQCEPYPIMFPAISVSVRSSQETNSTFTVFRKGILFNTVDSVQGILQKWNESPEPEEEAIT